jgi:glycerate 2-kinase
VLVLSFHVINKRKLASTGNRADRALILRSLEDAVDAVLPGNVLARKLNFRNNVLTFLPTREKYDFRKYDKVVVVGAGKASGFLAQSIEKLLGPKNIAAGYVNILQGTRNYFKTKRIQLNEASHPVPNRAGEVGAEHIVHLLGQLSEDSLAICLISGGGSSLLPLPTPDITLSDEVRTTDLLLKAGANIDEMNCVRKHISRVKGGQLVKLAKNRPQFLSLIMSDVVGDHLESIASGPTAPDPTTYGEALQILERYDLTRRVPSSVLAHLKRGHAGEEKETPKPGDEVFSKVSNHIIASNRDACMAAIRNLKTSKAVRSVNYLGSYWHGEAVVLAQNLAGFLCHGGDQNRGLVQAFVWGGEATVTVHGNGKGGRNQEQALAALEIIGTCERKITAAFFATDGVDGKTDAAGAVIDCEIFSLAKKKKLDCNAFLRNNDSNTLFKKLGDSLIITGPSGTNVNDVGIALVRLRT